MTKEELDEKWHEWGLWVAEQKDHGANPEPVVKDDDICNYDECDDDEDNSIGEIYFEDNIMKECANVPENAFYPRSRKEALKPCPFCGSKSVFYCDMTKPDDVEKHWTVICHKCFTTLNPWLGASKKEIREMWNRREAPQYRYLGVSIRTLKELEEKENNAD